jgi:hypothetical protein
LAEDTRLPTQRERATPPLMHDGLALIDEHSRNRGRGLCPRSLAA